MTVETLKCVRNDESFDLFWSKVNSCVSARDIADARRCRRPVRYDDGLSGGDFHDTPKGTINSTSILRLLTLLSTACILNCFD